MGLGPVKPDLTDGKESPEDFLLVEMTKPLRRRRGGDRVLKDEVNYLAMDFVVVFLVLPRLCPGAKRRRGGTGLRDGERRPAVVTGRRRDMKAGFPAPGSLQVIRPAKKFPCPKSPQAFPLPLRQREIQRVKI